MYERGFAHQAWRRCETAGNAHDELVQLFRLLNSAKLFDDGSDRVLFTWLDDVTARELVRINVADQFAQRFEMLAPRDRLIVFFDERNRQVCVRSKKGRLYRHTPNPVIFR